MDTKYCGTCKRDLPINQFHKDRTRNDGLHYQCKLCKKTRAELWRQKNPDYMTEYRKTKRYQKASLGYRTKYPVRIQANNAVNRAVVEGELLHITKCLCADCGDQAVHYHHESYDEDKWLDVVPLCQSCHFIRHRSGVLIEQS